MSITKGGDNKLVYTPITDFDRFGLTGVMRHDSFAICADKDQLKQIQFDPSDQATNTIVLFKSGANSSSITLTLPTTSGTLVTSAGIGSSFTTMQTDMGTFPVATSPTDTLTLTSSDGSVNITGDSATDTVDFVVDTTAIAANFWSVSGNTTGGNKILGSLDSFDWDIVANNVSLIRLNTAQSSVSISSNSALPTFADLPLNVNRAIGIEGNGLELANIRFEIGGGGADPASPTDGVVLYYSEDHGNRFFNLKRTDGTKVAFSFQDPVSDAAANFPATLSGTDDLVFKNLAQDLVNKNLDSSTINNTAFETGTIILGPSLVDAQFSGTGTTVVTTDSGGHLSPQAILSAALGGTGNVYGAYTPNGVFWWSGGSSQFVNGSQLTFNNTTLTVAPNGLTGSAATSALSISQNWNTSGNPTGILFNATTGTAGASALLADFQLASVSQVSIAKSGTITTLGSFSGNQLSARATGSTIKIRGGASTSTISGVSIDPLAVSTITSGNHNTLELTANSIFSPTSGTGTYNAFILSPEVNQTGGANGITRGIYINPTLTAASDFRGLELSQNSKFSIYQSGASAINYLNGKVGLGITAPIANLDVSGTSAAPATSGQAAFGGMRFGNTGAGIAFDIGFNGSLPSAWMQVRNTTDYSQGYDLQLNPVKGKVTIGLGASAIGAATLDVKDTVLSGSGSLAGSIFNLVQTWNTTGAPTAIKLNILTGTADAASLLMDLQSTSTSQFKVSKAGTMTATGDLISSTAGKGLQIKEGSNAKMGVSTLVAGTVVVSTTAVTANSRIFLTGQNNAGTIGDLRVTARTAGTSFTISSTTALDVSDVAWILIEPS